MQKGKIGYPLPYQAQKSYQGENQKSQRKYSVLTSAAQIFKKL